MSLQSRIRFALHHALLAALVAPTLIACSGKIEGGADAATTDTDASTDAGDAGGCDPTSHADASVANCGDSYPIHVANASACERLVGSAPERDSLDWQECTRLCGGYAACWVTTPSTVECEPSCAVDGRRPEGLEEAQVTAGDSLGAHFARVAHIEAASVVAFHTLARELEGHGAPSALVDAARRAAGDEVRHARVTGALASRFGGSVARPEVAPPRARSLEEIVLENEIEGCVRETYSALLASYQAARASDPKVRAAMTRIARDETKHAELAWSVSTWARSKLSRATLARLDDARLEAADALAREVQREPSRALRSVAGLPSAETAARMLGALRQRLWS